MNPIWQEKSSAEMQHVPAMPDECVSERKHVAVLLWSRRRLLFRAMVIGAVVSLLIAFIIPAWYDSTVTLLPPESSMPGAALLSSLVGDGSGLASLALSSDFLGGMRNGGDLVVGVLKSRVVQDKLINKFDLQKVYSKRYRYTTRKELAENTDISQDHRSGIITVVVSDHDPVRAQQMAQAYVDEANRALAELNTSSAHRERVFLEGRLKEVKHSLDDAAQKFSAFSSRNTTLDLQQEGRAAIEAIATLQGQLIAAKSELSGLQQIYTASNARVKSVQARIEELQRQLDKLLGHSVPMDPGTDESPAIPTVRQLPLLGVQYADLYRQVKVQETVFEILTKQYELAKVSEAKELPTVKIIDNPERPERRSGPPRLLILLFGTFASLIFVTVWIIATDMWRNVDDADPTKSVLTQIGHTIRHGRLPALAGRVWRTRSNLR